MHPIFQSDSDNIERQIEQIEREESEHGEAASIFQPIPQVSQYLHIFLYLLPKLGCFLTSTIQFILNGLTLFGMLVQNELKSSN